MQALVKGMWDGGTIPQAVLYAGAPSFACVHIITSLCTWVWKWLMKEWRLPCTQGKCGGNWRYILKLLILRKEISWKPDIKILPFIEQLPYKWRFTITRIYAFYDTHIIQRHTLEEFMIFILLSYTCWVMLPINDAHSTYNSCRAVCL